MCAVATEFSTRTQKIKQTHHVFYRITTKVWYNAPNTHASVPKRDATAGNLITNWGKFFVPAPVPRDFIRYLDRESIQTLEHTMEMNKFYSISQADGITVWYNKSLTPFKLGQVLGLCHCLPVSNCHSIQPTLSSHQGTWIHREGSLCSLRVFASAGYKQALSYAAKRST